MRHVGHEPSGRKFNAFELDERNPAEKKPFNPMINAGAIVTASLLKPDYEPADVRRTARVFFSKPAMY